MDKERKNAIRRRIGPVAMSLVAAAITAVGFAAISVAKDDSKGQGDSGARAAAPGGPPAGGVMFQQRLSDEDRQKLDEFRQCMEDNGAPAPPDPGEMNSSEGPPKPPSKADMEKIQKAHEACKDKLPEGMQNGPQGGIGGPGCGPPPGAPPNQEHGQNRQ